jgi:ParB family chromosome partitioning protein
MKIANKSSLKKAGLGRGLSALISSGPAARQVEVDAHPSSPSSATLSDSALLNVKLSDVVADPDQPRRNFSTSELEELATSIKEVGIISPIVVKQTSTGYQIIAGERRFRAAKIAGLSRVPVIVRKEPGAAESLEIALIENIQRANLSPIEEALGYRRLVEEYGLTQKEVAEKVGKDRTSVANALRLLQLPEAIRNCLEAGEISVGHAKAILTVKEPAAQLGLMKKIIDEQLSVRALEEIVARSITLAPERKAKQRSNDETNASSSYVEVERRLERILGTRVRIKSKPDASAGKIEVAFFGPEEFERLLQTLGA